MHVYGPVPSRRLGRSLGVDPIPHKTCNFSCVYCQLGRTTHMTNERKDFFPRNEIFDELARRINEVGIENIDYITFVGDGEPTLCKSLGWLIEEAKKEFAVPVAVVTNGALLYDSDVRDEVSAADVVLPTLDAGTEKIFKKINRPHKYIKFDAMVDGMIEFRKRFNGKIWIEFMAVAGTNDTVEELQKVREILDKINPDAIYVNVPIRPPAESWVKIPSGENMIDIHKILGTAHDISSREVGEFQVASSDVNALKSEIAEIVRRHPMRHEQLVELLAKNGIESPEKLVEVMKSTNAIFEIQYDENTYYVNPQAKRRT